MKKRLVAAATAIVIILQLFVLCSCDELLEAVVSGINSALNESDESAPAFSEVTSNTSSEAKERENVIPFYTTPKLESFTLPDEDYADDLEREAAEIIDAAIEKAVSCVNTMKDDRHSKTSYPFVEDAGGYIGELTAKQKKLYEKAVAAARKGSDFSMTEEEYGSGIKDAFFALYRPMSYCAPDVISYFDFTLTNRDKTLMGFYFDPYKDQNASVQNGDVKKSDVIHAAKLLDRVVKRIVRFMPSGLSTYDQYYYLAVVLCEKASYDARPANCFTAFGALITGRCVCEGYAAAYYLLCKEANLWCAYRNGLPEGTGHGWNMVKLDSGIYNVDVTWCDGATTSYSPDWYDYFIKSDEDFVNDGHNATSGVTGTGTFEPSPYEASRKGE